MPRPPAAATGTAEPARGGEPIRFVLAGLFNTAVSLGAYWLLLLVAPYTIAYTVSFAVGVLSAFSLNTFIVFRVPWSWRKLAAFPAVQAINYLAGLSILAFLVGVVGIRDAYAPLISIPATIPLNFLLSRALMRRV